jgi:hypothetical protein
MFVKGFLCWRRFAMRVRVDDRSYPDTPAIVEAGDDVLTRDFYTLLPQIRLTGDSTGRLIQPEPRAEVTLDGNDVANLVECAIRHPSPNMRTAVLAAIRNHPDTFREIFRFGLTAPAGFPEIQGIVAKELDKCLPRLDSPASKGVGPTVETLLPRMPLPAHLRGRKE